MSQASKKIHIRGGRLIDPGRIDGIRDVLIEDGRIAAIEMPGKISDIGSNPADDAVEVIDANGCIVCPGLIDLHVHLREPGFEYKETIESGTRAAAAGGFTAVCAMPNTNPPNDCPEVTTQIRQKADAAGFCHVFPVAAITRGMAGQALTDFSALKTAGAVAFSDDGLPVTDAGMMRKAMDAARSLDVVVIPHCEVPELAAGGVLNEGPVALRLGVQGIPNVAESIMVIRDIALCELTGARLHIAHVSTAESVRAIRDAKGLGLPVTAETAPHYFTLTEEAVETYGTRAKMNPPLRALRDREAIIQGLVDGTIDAIATDHAPHAESEKAWPLDQAPNGIIGLETALPLGLELVRNGHLDMAELIRKMSTQPAAIMGLDRGISIGGPANLTIFDPDEGFIATEDSFFSAARNSPFIGWSLKGRAVATIRGDKIVYRDRISLL